MPDSARILLLRGVNVGGRHILPMAGLREVLADLGFRDVATHIQSGNAVFRDPQALPGAAGRITEAIAARFGFAPRALVLDRSALEGVLAANPFAAAGQARGAAVQIGFLTGPALAADTAALAALAAPDEAFQLTPAAFYLHAPSGIGRSKLAERAERLLGVAMTMRNQGVAEALVRMAAALPC